MSCNLYGHNAINYDRILTPTNLLPSSGFLWRLTNQGYAPPQYYIETWIKAISDPIGITFRCTDYICTILVRRAIFLRTKSRKIKGSQQRTKFLAAEWHFKVPVSDVVTVDTLRTENACLTKEVEDLTTELKVSTTQLRRLTDEKQGRGRSRKHALIDDYSARQKTHIKKQRTQSCKASLQWMKDEDYTPLRVIALNPHNQEEEITLHQDMEHAYR